jgi:hypothetical protein
LRIEKLERRMVEVKSRSLGEEKAKSSKLEMPVLVMQKI